MTEAILALVASIVGFIIWLWKRKAAQNETPQAELLKRETAAREIISSQDVDSLNRSVDERLRAINRNLSGQRDSTLESRPNKSEEWVSRAGRKDAGNP